MLESTTKLSHVHNCEEKISSSLLHVTDPFFSFALEQCESGIMSAAYYCYPHHGLDTMLHGDIQLQVSNHTRTSP